MQYILDENEMDDLVPREDFERQDEDLRRKTWWQNAVSESIEDLLFDEMKAVFLANIEKLVKEQNTAWEKLNKKNVRTQKK